MSTRRSVILHRVRSVATALVPDLTSSLIVCGVGSITLGVGMYDRRLGLITFGLFCFAGLFARVQWGAR